MQIAILKSKKDFTNISSLSNNRCLMYEEDTRRTKKKIRILKSKRILVYADGPQDLFDDLTGYKDSLCRDTIMIIISFTQNPSDDYVIAEKNFLNTSMLKLCNAILNLSKIIFITISFRYESRKIDGIMNEFHVLN